MDDNLATYTNPSNQTTVTDTGVNRIYIAVETADPIPSGYSGRWTENTVDLLVSTNGGASYTGAETDIRPVSNPPPPPPPPPTLVGANHIQGPAIIETDVAPKLSVSQNGGLITVLYDDIVGARGNKLDNLYVDTLTPSAAGVTVGARSIAATTSVLGAVNSPYPLTSTASPLTGIGPGAVIADDNSLGNGTFSGRIYVAYTDRFDSIRYPARSTNNPTDNTDIFLAYSDNNGKTWTIADNAVTGAPGVNDDYSDTDGFSDSISTPVETTGRPQFSPSLAVDPQTGTAGHHLRGCPLRRQPRSRTVESLQTSIDGGTTFSPSTYVDKPEVALDENTELNAVLGPVPANQNQPSPPLTADAGIGGIGNHQGLAVFGGRIYTAFASNLNGGNNQTNGNTHFNIYVAPFVFASGPRVIDSTMGVVTPQTVTDPETAASRSALTTPSSLKAHREIPRALRSSMASPSPSIVPWIRRRSFAGT